MGGQRFFAFLDEGVNGTDAAQPEACYPKNTRGKKTYMALKNTRRIQIRLEKTQNTKRNTKKREFLG